MKRFTIFLSVILLLASQLLPAQEAGGFLTVAGRVIDNRTGRPLPYASVTLSETHLSNITNSEGVFTLKIPAADAGEKLSISHLGYALTVKPVREFAGTSADKPLTIRMIPVSLTLDPATIKAMDAEELVATAFSRVRFNYPQEKMGLTAFYREMIRKGDTKYLSLNEAIIDINKAAYHGFGADRAGIYKGRGSVNYDASDTLLIQYQGGVIGSLAVDQARNPFCGVAQAEMFKYYDFRLEQTEMLDDKLFYVVSFDQKPGIDEIWFRGRLYIDAESLAIGRVEMNMNVEGREDATQIFIKKKPLRTRIDVLSAEYVVNYKNLGGLWYYDYARICIRIDTKRKYALLKTHYSITSELAVTDRSLKEKAIPAESKIKFSDKLSQRVSDFTDDNFWESYNIIEPDTSIDIIIKKIVKQLKKRERN